MAARPNGRALAARPNARPAPVGDGTPSVTVEALRRGLQFSDHPNGMLRGSVARPPPALQRQRLAVALDAREGSDSGSGAAISGSSAGNGISDSGAATGIIGVRATCIPRAQSSSSQLPLPSSTRQRHERALDLRRAHRLVKFTGKVDDYPSDGWCCAICLQSKWPFAALTRMPRCQHVFHTSCVERWFLKSGDCPFCRQPV